VERSLQQALAESDPEPWSRTQHEEAGLERSRARHIGILGRSSRQDSRTDSGVLLRNATTVGNAKAFPQICLPATRLLTYPRSKVRYPRNRHRKADLWWSHQQCQCHGRSSSTPTSSDLARRTDPSARSSREHRSPSRHPAQEKRHSHGHSPTNERDRADPHSPNGPEQPHILGQASPPCAHKRQSGLQLLHASSMTPSFPCLPSSCICCPWGYNDRDLRCFA